MVRWVGVAARLVLGGTWLWAGLLKLPHPDASVTAVRAYQLLPQGSTDTVGRLLPIVEVALGVCLLLGVLTRVMGGVSAVLQVAFVVAIASLWARGIAISCGCFGDGGADPDALGHYPWEIARDVGLAALALWLVVRPRTPYAVDNALFPDPRPAHLPATEPSAPVEETRVRVES